MTNSPLQINLIPALLLFLLCPDLLHVRPPGHMTLALHPDSPPPQGLHKLMYDLFRTYLPEARPVTSGNTTHVYLAISLRSIRDLDEKAQVFETSIVLDATWQDEYLIWDGADFNGTSSFLCPQSMVWLPDIIIENSVESQSQMGYDQNVVRVNSSGTVRWMPSEVISTACDIDVTYYPFDIQTCCVTISTWMSGQDEIDILPAPGLTGFKLDNYSTSGTWDIISNTLDVLPNGDNPTTLKFTLRLKRLRTYYVLNIMLPILFLSFTASMVFLLPAEAGEKIGMGITVLLSYAVYLSIIADDMPQTSLQVSYLAVYLTLLLGLTAMGVVLAVVVLHIHHKPEDARIGHTTRSVTRKIRTLLAINKTKSLQNLHSRKDFQAQDSTNGVNSLPEKKDNLNVSRSRGSITPLNEEVKFSSLPAHDKDQEEITWPKVAETLDRVLFLFTSTFIAIMTFVFLPVIASSQ